MEKTWQSIVAEKFKSDYGIEGDIDSKILASDTDTKVFGVENMNSIKNDSDINLDQPNGGEVIEGDIEAAKKIQVPETPEFFNRNDITNETKADQNQDTNNVADDNNSNSFTVDQPEKPKLFLNVDWKKPIKMTPEEPVDNSLEKPAADQEKSIGKLEEMALKADLRYAVDEYNKLIAKAVRLKKDIEAKGGNNGEIPKINITDALEDTRLHDPRVVSAVKSRLIQELKEELKNQDSKSETEQYENTISEIEPIKTRVSEALESLLAKTFKSFDVERIRLSMANLVVEDDVTLVHKQDWEAICLNRKSEIDEQANTKEATIDQLPGVQPSIIEGITKTNPEQNEEIEAKTDQVPGVSPTIIKQIEEKPQIKESAATSDDADTAISADKPEQKAIAIDSAPEAPQPAKFVEFAAVDEEGIVSQDKKSSYTEVDLNQKKGDVVMKASVLDSLKKGDGVPKETGVVNLTSNDLENPLDITDKRHAIRQRLKELQKAGQTVDPGSDFFGPGLNDIKDVANNPLSQGDSMDVVVGEPIREEALSTVKEDVLPEKVAPKPVHTEQISETQGSESIKLDKPSLDINTPLIGPDLVAQSSENVQEQPRNIEIAMPEEKPSDKVQLKKKGLFKRFSEILNLGKKKDITAREVKRIDDKVMGTRAATVEAVAEQAEK